MWIKVWEFLRFWGENVKTGWEFGDGIFGTIVEICLVIGAGLFILKKIFKSVNLEKHWKEWEEIAMRGAFIIFFTSFLISAVFVAPFVKYNEVKEPLHAAAIDSAPKVTPKPLPDKIIPRPEPPPPMYTQQTAIVSPPVTSETQAQFEYFNTHTGKVESIVKKFAKLKAEQEAQNAAQAAKLQENIQKRNLEIQQIWKDDLRYYQRALTDLRDDLEKEIATNGDGIVQSEGYSRCLPSAIDPNIGEMNPATIGFQKNTNMLFKITLTALDNFGGRLLRISCPNGCLELHGFQGRLWGGLHFDPVKEDKDVPFSQADSLVDELVDGLVDAQKDFLSNTNK